MRRNRQIAMTLSLALLIAACGGGGGSENSAAAGGSDDGEGTPFEGIGDAADNVELLDAGPLTVNADPGHTWVEADGERTEFSNTDSEQLDCIVNDEQLSVIYRNEDGSEVRLNGLLLPGGWNLSLTITAGQDSVMNGASLRGGTFGMEDVSVSYEGLVDIVEFGEVVSQVDVVLAANCNS